MFDSLTVNIAILGKDNRFKKELSSLSKLDGFNFSKINELMLPKMAYNSYKGKFLSTALLNFLEKTKNNTTEIVLGICSCEIYFAGTTSILGEASPKRGVAIISTARINNFDTLKKEILHELSHLFGVEHCQNPSCPVSITYEINDIADKNETLCIDCQKNIKIPKLKKNDEKVLFIYSHNYYADIGLHVFPTEKYRLLYKKLKENNIVNGSNALEPYLATYEDLTLVHKKEYVNDLLAARATKMTILSELPINKEIINAFRLSCGGSILATKKAKETGCSLNLGGGFHHAFSDHAEGFCYINDVAVAAKYSLKNNLAEKILVIDCDLHQGNGTAKIFQKEPNVFTFSIHQENNYPVKEKSNLDIGLPDGADDSLYLSKLRKNIPPILEFFKPDLIIYVAGADPYKEDQLGGLNLTMEGLKERDELIYSLAFHNKIPIMTVLAGGYAYKVEDTVEIHYNTCLSACQIFE